MGWLDGLLGGSGGSSADDLYAGLLTPQQLAAIRQRSAGDDLLKLAGAFAQAGQASRLPTGGIGSAIGQAASSLAGGGDEAILKFLQAQKLGAEVIDKKSLAEARRALLADLQKSGQIPPGFLGGTPGAGAAPDAVGPLAAPGAGDGTVSTPRSSTGGYTIPKLYDLAVQAGYKPGTEAATAAAIAMAESSGNPGAHNTKGEDSYGLMQLNADAHGDLARTFDPLENMKASRVVSGEGTNWRPWSVYKNGAYQQYLPDALAYARSGGSAYGGMGGGGDPQTPRSLDELRGVVAGLQPGGGEGGGGPYLNVGERGPAPLGGLLEQAYPNDPRRFGGAAGAADPLRQQYDAARARYGDRAPAESFDQYRARFAQPGSGGGVPLELPPGAGGDTPMPLPAGAGGGGVADSGLLRGGVPLLPSSGGGPLAAAPMPAGPPAAAAAPSPGAGPLAAPVTPGPGPGPVPGPGLLPGAPPTPPSSAPVLPPAPASNPEMQRYIYDIARKGALAEIAGLPNVYAPLLSALQGSPQYKAIVEAATTYARESTALGFAKPKAAAEAEGKQPYDLQQRQYQSQLDREREALARTGGAELDVQKYQVPDGRGGIIEKQMTRQDAADYFSRKKDIPGLPSIRSASLEPDGAPPTGVPVYSEGAKVAFDKLLARRDQALDLASSLEGTAEARRLLNSGVITGTGAGGRLALAKAWGLVTGETGDNVANTETFIANQAQAVARQIKAFGSGTGLSNADREYAAKMVGGETEYDEKSLRKILDIQDRAVRGYLKQFNKDATAVSPAGLPYPLRVDLPEVAPIAPAAPARTAGPATSAQPATGPEAAPPARQWKENDSVSYPDGSVRQLKGGEWVIVKPPGR